MRALILLAAVAPLLAAGPAPKARPIAPATFVEWKSTDGTRSFTQGGVTATLSARRVDAEPVLTVSAPGKTPLRIVVDDSMANYTSTIGIGPLVRGQGSAVLFQAYTGGAHCCAHVIAVLPAGKSFVEVDFGAWDGDSIPWPKDVSGDGVADFRFRDQSFLYAFGSYAGSWPPLLVMTIRGTKAVDVSTDPVFRPLYAAELVEARKGCNDGANDVDGGACAGYLATLARVSPAMFDREWTRVMAMKVARQSSFPNACSDSPRPTPCYADYPSSLRALLRTDGYIE